MKTVRKIFPFVICNGRMWSFIARATVPEVLHVIGR